MSQHQLDQQEHYYSDDDIGSLINAIDEHLVGDSGPPDDSSVGASASSLLPTQSQSQLLAKTFSPHTSSANLPRRQQPKQDSARQPLTDGSSIFNRRKNRGGGHRRMKEDQRPHHKQKQSKEKGRASGREKTNRGSKGHAMQRDTEEEGSRGWRGGKRGKTRTKSKLVYVRKSLTQGGKENSSTIPAPAFSSASAAEMVSTARSNAIANAALPVTAHLPSHTTQTLDLSRALTLSSSNDRICGAKREGGRLDADGHRAKASIDSKGAGGGVKLNVTALADTRGVSAGSGSCSSTGSDPVIEVDAKEATSACAAKHPLEQAVFSMIDSAGYVFDEGAYRRPTEGTSVQVWIYMHGRILCVHACILHSSLCMHAPKRRTHMSYIFLLNRRLCPSGSTDTHTLHFSPFLFLSLS